jgi:hypothetical protein
LYTVYLAYVLWGVFGSSNNNSNKKDSYSVCCLARMMNPPSSHQFSAHFTGGESQCDENLPDDAIYNDSRRFLPIAGTKYMYYYGMLPALAPPAANFRHNITTARPTGHP